MQKSLVIATHGLGDLIMTCQAAGVNFQHNNVTFLVSGQVEKTLLELIFPEKVSTIVLNDYLTKGMIGYFHLLKKIRSEKFDLVLSQYGVSRWKFFLVSYLSQIKQRIGWSGKFSFFLTNAIAANEHEHKVIQTRRLLDIAFTGDIKGKLFDVATKCEEYIVLGPMSFEKEKHKRWPRLKYQNLIEIILREHPFIDIYLVGSKSERDYLDKLRLGNPSIKNLAGELDLRDSIRVIGRAKLVVANCNAISHFAAAANVPIIGLYGPTNYGLTGPFSTKFTPLTNEFICAPCYREGFIKGCQSAPCMSSIEVESVYQEVKKILTRGN